MPISFFEGVRVDERDDARRPSLERRFRALAAAVRAHESRVRGSGSGPAREDEDLYRRLHQLAGEPATSEHGAA
jgi:hypothetical protein